MASSASSKRLCRIEDRLKAQDRWVPFSGPLLEIVPNRPGIYAVWKFERRHSPVYVGETANLAERFDDLKYWHNHTFTRQIRKVHRFKQGKSIRTYIDRNYLISFLRLSFGRKEAEEFLIHKWKTYKKFNKKSPRYLNAAKRTLEP